jgi:hypothetical protein
MKSGFRLGIEGVKWTWGKRGLKELVFHSMCVLLSLKKTHSRLIQIGAPVKGHDLVENLGRDEGWEVLTDACLWKVLVWKALKKVIQSLLICT